MITLATLSAATAQQVFDQVKTHLLTQMEKSQIVCTDGYLRCKYRAGTLMCAAGCLISDDEYKEDMDVEHPIGNSWDAIIDRFYAPKSHEDLVSMLQWVHDQNEPSTWAEKLKMVAGHFKLEYKV